MSLINTMPLPARFSSGLPAKSLTQISSSASTLPGLVTSSSSAINSTSKSANDDSSAIAKYEKSKLDIGISLIAGSSVNVDSQNSAISPHYPTSCVEMIDSDKWIKKYGLRANKLTYEHILNLIGFKQTQDYLKQFKKSITSKYGQGLFLQTQSKDGLVYNITVTEDRLLDLAHRLEDAIELFKLRLKWLNTDSRRLFGVITESSLCLVLDCKQKDVVQFSQFRNCILKLLREQISKISSFNIIRCSDNIESFKDKAIVVSAQSIEEAIDWLNAWNRSFVKPSTDTSTCEGVLMGLNDATVEAVYLVSEGVSSNGSREILYDKLVKESHDKKRRLNVVSYNCVEMSTVEYLRRLAVNAYGPGRFHAYCLLRHFDDYTAGPIDLEPTKSQIIHNRKSYGGAPPGAGVKSDLMLVFEEIQLAKETLDNLKALIESMNLTNSTMAGKKGPAAKLLPARSGEGADSSRAARVDEEYMTSREWLQKHGLAMRKLELFDALSQVCFRHCDGVVDLKREPVSGKLFFVGDGVQYFQGDAIPKEKLVNAKYCDQFAHVLWHDGTIMHVHVTPELHRNFEQRMTIALEQYEKRIDWMSRGSRELFGTVIENNICILIDTSQSMQASLDFVKKKLAVLIQEQLKGKQRFNLVSFNSKINTWRDRMVEVDQFNLNSSLDWIKSLNAQGSTNTLAAIRFALSDMNTEAIYLLSDGRPDQDPKQILSQVHLNTRVPIHTISFNCNDNEANKFLNQLARETNGRYHYFNENGWDADPNGPIPYESEDTALLKQEIEKGLKYISQIAKLREECSRLSIGGKYRELNKSPGLKRNLSDEDCFNLDDLPQLDLKSEGKFVSKYRSKSSFNLAKENSLSGVLSSLHDLNSLDWILPETKQLLERQLRLQSKTKKAKPKAKSEMDSIIHEYNSLFNGKQATKKQRKVTGKLRPIDLNEKISIRKWLQRNSLRALKLTILDALEPTLVKQTPEHVKILHKYVESKVWNDILEFAHVSDSEKAKFKLLNPSVVDLGDYEKNLKNQIKLYRRFLAERIWAVLPQSERDITDLKPPFEYDDESKARLLGGLEVCEWPISREDVELVEKEIALAEKFLQQSADLRQYYKSKLETFNKREAFKDLVDTARSTGGATASSGTGGGGEATRINLTTASNTDITLVNQKALRTERSESPRAHDSTQLSTAESLELRMKSTKDKEEKLARGDRVIARNDLLGYYYPGKVSRVLDSRHANIKFDKGPRQNNMSFRNIIKTSGMTPYLCLGDYVMASVINEHEERCWVPGIVQFIDHGSYPKMFSILYFNGQEGENTRSELVKINKSMYGFITNFIRSKLGIRTNVKVQHEVPKPQVPDPRPPTPPVLDDLKKDIIDQIKTHFDSLRLDDKYQRMYDELYQLRKKQKGIRHDLDDKLKILRTDFEEFRKCQPLRIQGEPFSPDEEDEDEEARSASDRNSSEEEEKLRKSKKKSTSSSLSSKKEKSVVVRKKAESAKTSKKSASVVVFKKETKKTKSKSRRTSDDEDEEEVEEVKYYDDDEEEEEEAPIRRRAATKAKPRSSDEEEEDVEPVVVKKKLNKKPTKSPVRKEEAGRQKSAAAMTGETKKVDRRDYDPVPSPRYPDKMSQEEKLFRLRRELPTLTPGEEVLARWPDDGWYYRSVVKDHLGNFKYQIEDGLRDQEEMYREDIISELSDAQDSFEAGDPVVALHPHYAFSYAPGQVVQVSNDLTRMVIRFYDFVESVVFREDVYRLDRLKFQLDVNQILKLEKQWIGQTVVARNNYTNVYELGKVVSQVGNGRQYIVEWSNGKQSIQNSNHIFGVFTRNPKMIVNDYVLAPKETIFLPGRIIGMRGEQLRVKFVDGVVDDRINYSDCYWLSRDYYDDACRFYRRESDPSEELQSTLNNSFNRATPVLDAKEFSSSTVDRIRNPKF